MIHKATDEASDATDEASEATIKEEDDAPEIVASHPGYKSEPDETINDTDHLNPRRDGIRTN